MIACAKDAQELCVAKNFLMNSRVAVAEDCKNNLNYKEENM